ncbi:hypothetical protein BC940DRAFT_318892 [Gongronella butleri]|nr:hypothetical protein BC940DRAFT_318892 [Gongronella butleri]
MSNSIPIAMPICDKRNAWDRPSSGLYSPISGSMPTGASPVHGVDVTITLAKHMWVAGALMYVDMTLENQSMHTIEDIHIELIRRQNTFANMRRSHPFGLMPVTSSCESIAATSLHEKGWWQPIAPNCKDHVTIPLDIPAHAFTIKLQKLVDISFAVRVAIRSHASRRSRCTGVAFLDRNDVIVGRTLYSLVLIVFLVRHRAKFARNHACSRGVQQHSSSPEQQQVSSMDEAQLGG